MSEILCISQGCIPLNVIAQLLNGDRYPFLSEPWPTTLFCVCEQVRLEVRSHKCICSTGLDKQKISP